MASADVSELHVTALAPWFGSNRMLGAKVGAAVAGREWVGVPFCGGMAEIPHIDARAIVLNDKNRHIINLGRVIQRPELRAELCRRVRYLAFHPDNLDDAQREALAIERGEWQSVVTDADMVRAAAAYFVCVWMGRSATAGTKRELYGSLSTRWTVSGGDSLVRYRSAVRSIVGWSRIFRRCNFTTICGCDFLDNVPDLGTHAVYADPTFPGAGDAYKYVLTMAQHERFSRRAAALKQTLVVVRYYDCDAVRAWYPPASGWVYYSLVGRKQSNREATEELLITNQRVAALEA